MTELDLARTERAPAAGGEGSIGDYFALLKPRVMSLVVFTAFVGMAVAPGGIHPWIGLVALVAISIGAGASGALNMWYDADIDGRMRRTAERPVPRGAILEGEALGFGLMLAAGSVVVLGILVNWLSAALLAFTIFFYAVVYTMWLKRWTAQNIVIGGAAGAFPPVIAWAAATGTIDPASFTLFLLIFLWTPPHFWALALLRSEDYARVGVPMLPVVAGEAETRRQILLYTLTLVPAAILPAVVGIGGALYLALALALTLRFVQLAWNLYREPSEEMRRKAAGRLFGFSIAYLFAVFGALLLDRLVGPLPWWWA